MSRLGGVTAPLKCEENLRKPINIKKEQCDEEKNHEKSHAEHLTDYSVGNPSSSSPSSVETDNNYEFLGHMKYEADESNDLTTTEPPSIKKRDKKFCHLCQQIYYKKTRYGFCWKRDFIAHLAKAHNCHHLRGHRVYTLCRSCNTEKRRWSFVVVEGDNYKFSDECSTCQAKSRGRLSIASQWKNFMAHQESNAEIHESREATAETPTDGEEPGGQADAATDLTTTEDPSSKKRDGSVCHLCQQVYYKKASHKKQYFVAHLVNAHKYRHLRGHSVYTLCRSCNTEKRRYSFVVGEGDTYKFSDECGTCQWNHRGRASMASQGENLMAHQDLSAELQESPEETAETPTVSKEPVPSEAHL